MQNELDMNNLPPRLSRAHASEYLKRKHGISRTPGTLAKLATIGGGPMFRKAGNKYVVYDVSALDQWVSEIMSEARETHD